MWIGFCLTWLYFGVRFRYGMGAQFLFFAGKGSGWLEVGIQGEEAVGDRYNRGGGNMAKAIGLSPCRWFFLGVPSRSIYPG